MISGSVVADVSVVTAVSVATAVGVATAVTFVIAWTRVWRKVAFLRVGSLKSGHAFGENCISTCR